MSSSETRRRVSRPIRFEQEAADLPAKHERDASGG
jgi:hypothetical protein